MGLVCANAYVWTVVRAETHTGVLRVSVLDVGQGDAIFIETPSGNQMLLDGGPDRTILQRLSEVMPYGDHSIDILALSHPHKDHLEGFLDVLPLYEVGQIVDSGTENPTGEYRTWRQEIRDKQIKETVLRRGMRIDMGDGVLFSVVLPNGDVSSSTPHDGMLVMRLTYGDTSFMLTGDMEENLESLIVGSDGKNLASDVLKVGHHGSHTSSSEPFLDAVHPKYAVISSGKGNSYGHPHKETIEHLSAREIETHRTDLEGTVTFESDGKTVSVQ